MNERFIRVGHAIIFTLTLIFAVITLGVSSFLVAKYNKEGYPQHHTAAYRDRLRIILTASVWTTFWTLVFTIGFQIFGHSAIMGILTHLIPTVIAFLLFLIGVASVTGLTSKISCGNSSQTFRHCRTVKTAVVVGWIDTILLFIALCFVLAIAFKARAWGGIRRNTLYVD